MKKEINPILAEVLYVVGQDDGKVIAAQMVSDGLVEIPEDYPEDLRARLPDEEAVKIHLEEGFSPNREAAYRSVNFNRMYRY